MTTVLPTEVTYGTVTWDVLSAVADGGDADATPDALPVTGSVTFTPSATVFLDIPGDVTVIGTPVTYNLDANGVLRDSQGRNGVTLLATDSPGITPTGWTWRADFRLTNAVNSAISRGSFSFALPAGTTVSLTRVAPVSSSGGVPIVQGPQGDPGPPGPAGSTVKDSQGLQVVGPGVVGGATFTSYTYPTWGYGGSTAGKNTASPTLLDLSALGVGKTFWFPGNTGNLWGCPDTTALSGNVGGVPQTITITCDLVTNEYDPISGQSLYYLVAKPSCWLLRLTELGYPEAKAYDSASSSSGITFTANAQYPTKTHLLLRAVINPNDSGVASCTFQTSSDGVNWQQLGDVIYPSNPRTLGAYYTTSGATLGGAVIIGGNSNTSMYRGAMQSCTVQMGSTTALDVHFDDFTAGATSGTDRAGNVFTLNAPQTSNWVTQTCVAVGGGEYLTLTGSPAGQQLTTPGLYPSLSLPGFSWDLSKVPARTAYANANTVINLAQPPIASSFDFYMDPNSGAIYLAVGGVPVRQLYP